MSEQKIEKEGTVLEPLPNAQYKILLDNDEEAIGHLSGTMKQHNINVLPGDRVVIKLSPYDLSRGIITERQTND